MYEYEYSTKRCITLERGVLVIKNLVMSEGAKIDTSDKKRKSGHKKGAKNTRDEAFTSSYNEIKEKQEKNNLKNNESKRINNSDLNLKPVREIKRDGKLKDIKKQDRVINNDDFKVQKDEKILKNKTTENKTKTDIKVMVEGDYRANNGNEKVISENKHLTIAVREEPNFNNELKGENRSGNVFNRNNMIRKESVESNPLEIKKMVVNEKDVELKVKVDEKSNGLANVQLSINNLLDKLSASLKPNTEVKVKLGDIELRVQSLSEFKVSNPNKIKLIVGSDKEMVRIEINNKNNEISVRVSGQSESMKERVEHSIREYRSEVRDRGVEVNVELDEKEDKEDKEEEQREKRRKGYDEMKKKNKNNKFNKGVESYGFNREH